MNSPFDQTQRHGALTQIFHWLTAVLVISAFVLGPEDIEEMSNPGQDPGVMLHQTLGLIVFGLTILRIIWQFFANRPAAIPMFSWMKILSKSVQGAIYLLLLAVSMSAVLGISMEGHSITTLAGGQFSLNLPLLPSVGESSLEVHTVIADVMMWLVGIHAAAALFHHYVLRDQVLNSMLPKWGSKN